MKKYDLRSYFPADRTSSSLPSNARGRQRGQRARKMTQESGGVAGLRVRATPGIYGRGARQGRLDHQRIDEAFRAKSGSRAGGMAGHWFGRSQWELPTAANYQWLRELFAGDYLRREYEDLRREYEDLRREYEDLRRPSTPPPTPPIPTSGTSPPSPVTQASTPARSLSR